MLGRIFSTEIVQASTDDTNLPTDDQILGGLMQETTQEDEDRIQLDDSEVQELITYLNEMQSDLKKGNTKSQAVIDKINKDHMQYLDMVTKIKTEG